MRMVCGRRGFRLGATAAVVLVCVSAGGQATKPAGPAIALKAYTTSDQSASAGVPAGWTVTKGAETVIQMTGPEGVTVSLGNTIVAQNDAFQANTHLANGVDLTMPYTATLAQKLTMIFEQNAAVANKVAPQVTIDSSTALQLPAAVGQCARIVADMAGAQGAMKVMAVYCSLIVGGQAQVARHVGALDVGHRRDGVEEADVENVLLNAVPTLPTIS